MAMHRQLSALLFELQAAGSPVAKTKVLARAWRTVRDLSASDRRLLAREAGFAGAEEILEGLAKRRGGLAPALLLELLGNARSGGDESVGSLVEAVRSHASAGEVAARAADAAAELITGPTPAPTTEEAGTAIGPPGEFGAGIERAAEEALAALQAIEPERGTVSGASGGPAAAAPEPPRTAGARTGPPATRAPKWRPAPGWDLLARTPGGPRPRVTVREEAAAEPGPAGASTFAAPEVLAALGAQRSLLSRLLVLRRELGSFAGSSRATLQQLIGSFPDGWSRRRAVACLLEGGLAAEPADALALVAALGRERDRSWCLSVLAARGVLRGAELDRALELLGSPALRRRIEMVARAS